MTFISTAQIEHKRMTPVLCDLDELGWRVMSQLPNIFWLYLRKENRYSVCLNSTNPAQTNCNGLERFGQHGVESDVTRSKKECIISQKPNQHKRSFLRHKRSTNEWHSFGDYFFLWGANFTEVKRGTCGR